MKRLLFFILLALFVGAFLFQKVAQGSGYILISLGDTHIEMSFWTGIALCFLLVALIVLVWWGVSLVFNTVFSGVSLIGARSNRAVQKRTARGLINFIEGNWKQARSHLVRSASKAEYPLINYLAAARSTYELGNHKEAFDLLHKAETSASDSALAVALTQARMLLVGKKFEQCVANLERAKKIAPDHPVVLDLLQQAYVQLQDWKSLKTILPDLKQHKTLSSDALVALEQKLYLSTLHEVGEKARHLSPEAGLIALNSEWNAIPSALRKRTELVKEYVGYLVKLSQFAKAENTLRQTLKHNWHDSLVNCYGRIVGDDPRKQLLIAEDWLKERPGNAQLLLALGRLSLSAQRWPQAKSYFESSLKLEKSAETCAELGRLCANLGEYEKSSEYYQASFSLAADSLPNLPMPEHSQVVTTAKVS